MANKGWLSFDPTIHAGHVMTAITIIACTVGAYIAVVNDITFLKQENEHRKSEIHTEVESRRADIIEVKANAAELTKSVNTQFEGLRKDMNSWFMALYDKLDQKADKR
jgi:hypothetical protein